MFERKSVLLLLLCLFVVASGLALWLYWSNSVTTVILVRHAEKATGDNPSLTAEGKERAAELVKVLGDSGISAIYSTEYCRTTQTAEPLARHLQLPIGIKEVSGGKPGFESCDPDMTVLTERVPTGDDFYSELVELILTRHENETVIVVSHSNVTPRLVEELGAASPCPTLFPLDADGECHIPESQYYHLFIVKIPKRGSPTVIRAKYGVTPGQSDQPGQPMMLGN